VGAAQAAEEDPMGARGPVPKRSTERRRRNKEAKPEQVQPLVASVDAPPANPVWHVIARDWYASLIDSGQSQFFEPSDWQAARYVAEIMSRNLKQKKFSSVLFAAVWSAMSDLLTTEAARRRARMEIERNPEAPAQPAGVVAIASYRKAIGG
jgi:hypothetical protein